MEGIILEEEKEKKLSKKTARTFQSALLVTYFLALTGQRREIVMSVYIDV